KSSPLSCDRQRTSRGSTPSWRTRGNSARPASAADGGGARFRARPVPVPDSLLARSLTRSPFQFPGRGVGGWSRGRSFQRRIPAKLRRLTAPVFLLSLPLFPCSRSLPSPSPGSRLLRRPKRQAKPAADEGFWDCSVCTFRNSAEAFKCSICDVRKGTSTRKPRINSQLVAQQVAQQYATPPPPKKEKKEKVEKPDKEKPEKDKEISPSVTKKNTNKKTKPKSDILKDPPSEANSIQSANATTKTSETNHTSRPRLKNVDRSTAQQLAVTVGNVTVIITDFKEKTRSSSTSSSTVTSSAGSEQQNQSSSGSESTDKGSSRSSTPKGDMSAVNDESF
uniref:RING1 and YY1 binding protein n=1 Tax=Oryctolagus cuniculus TaxID=9986 RepID=G1T1U8_RABIT